MTPRPQDPVTLRLALSSDSARLDRLAQLDSARPLPLGQILVAESGDDLRAALSLVDGRVIANPFHRTAELVGMLVERSRQLETGRRRRRFYAGDFTLATNPRTSAAGSE